MHQKMYLLVTNNDCVIYTCFIDFDTRAQTHTSIKDKSVLNGQQDISIVGRKYVPHFHVIHSFILIQLNPQVELSAYAKHFLLPFFWLFIP